MRFWTIEEAQAELLRVAELVVEVQKFVDSAANAGAASNDGAPSRQWVEAVMDDFDELGIVFRDPSTGLIDFPSAGPDGSIRYLCWRPQDGETISWWHSPDEGFAGRQPI